MHFSDLGPVSSTAAASARPALVVFASLRWNFDYQRPQQLLTRLAARYRVFYVEEPMTTYQDAYLEASRPASGVEVLVPHTRVEAKGFHDDQVPVVTALLAEFFAERGVVEPLVCLYTPMALPLVADLAPRAVLYECMEDLAATLDAPSQLASREAALMAVADVVVAGGPSLYQARRGQHRNVHCIPNAVDAEHFAPTALAGSSIESISARALHAAIPNPRLGYFGAIDERIDLDLLARVADARPDWQLVMAGPVVRIDPATLPRRSNIHWLGPQTYAILPYLQAHWDLCILPLRNDETTRYASPRETLEYLAGQKSVVSTPVHDVVTLHGHVVRLAPDANTFVEACRAALCERGPLRRQRRIDALIAVHSCTWDRAAERIHKLLVEFAHETAPALIEPQESLDVQAAMLAAASLKQRRAARYAIV